LDSNNFIYNNIQNGIQYLLSENNATWTSLLQLSQVNNITISNTIFDHNWQQGHGAIVISDQLTEFDVFTIFNVSFTNNIALDINLTNGSIISSGAALFANNLSNLVIDSSFISNNYASQIGGAIYANNLNSLSIHNCNIQGNDAAEGGSIYGLMVGAINISTSTVPQLLVHGFFDFNGSGVEYAFTKENINQTNAISISLNGTTINVQGCVNLSNSNISVNLSNADPEKNLTLMNSSCLYNVEEDSIIFFRSTTLLYSPVIL